MDWFEPDLIEKVPLDVEEIKPRVFELIGAEEVVTDREVKIRLENEFFPWLTGKALKRLEKGNEINRVGVRGRRRKVTVAPEHFFTLVGTKYEDIEDKLIKKRQVSEYINGTLTGHASSAYHAEEVFKVALEELDFKILGEDVSHFKGRVVKGISGKPLGDLDFIIERDNVIWGVDVKNWLRYEMESRKEVIHKVSFAKDLGVVPFMFLRYVDKDTFYKEVVESGGGRVYQFRDLLMPSTFSSLADEARSLLGYPVLAVDSLPEYKKRMIEKIHQGYLASKK